jgi:uncharacterized membrane protein YhaH (DUF805 family)
VADRLRAFFYLQTCITCFHDQQGDNPTSRNAGYILLALIPAMLLISRRLKYDARRRFSYRSLMALSLLALAAFVAFLIFQGSLNAGLFQRAVVGTCVLWLLLTAIQSGRAPSGSLCFCKIGLPQ